MAAWEGRETKLLPYVNKRPSALKYILKYIIYNEMAFELEKLGTS